jgi:RimJ/RimL family protein N-acetyltransferase
MSIQKDDSIQWDQLPREITTKRLKLRQPGKDDFDGMFDIMSDSEAVKYWSDGPVEDPDVALKKHHQDLKSDKEGDSISWVICLKSNNQTIGRCVFFHLDKNNQRAEIGYILNRQFWRQGLMREALEAVFQFGFGPMQLHRIEADVDPDNEGSLALLESMGFKREGFFPERWFISGKWMHSVMLGLLNPD